MSELINIKSIEEFAAECDHLDEGFRDFLASVWIKLVYLSQGSQRAFMLKLSRENNKAKKVKMINDRIEELARDYISGILEKGKSTDSTKMLRLETYLIQNFKLYESITGKKHPRDIHRQTGLFDRVFLWPDLIPKGVTKEDIMLSYQDKIESIRTRADRKIKRAEEELAHWMVILP